MYSNNETIIVNKQALIQAVLKHERQEAYKTFLIWEYLTSLELLVDLAREKCTSAAV